MSNRFNPLTARIVAVALTASLFIALTGFRKVPHLSGEEVMQSVRDRHLADTEIDLVKMVTMDNQGNTQIRQFISVIAKDDNDNFSYLVRFLSPEDVRGVTLLTVETVDGVDQWLYLPALGEPRKVSGTSRAGSFMGSDFTFEDMRREDPAEHNHHRLQDDRIDGRSVYSIISAPAGADISRAADYAHRIIFVDKDNFAILRIDFYDEGRRLTKTFQASDYNSPEVKGTSLRPLRAVMANHEKGSTSMMRVLKSRLNIDVPEDIFTVDFLADYSSTDDDRLLDLLENGSN